MTWEEFLALLIPVLNTKTVPKNYWKIHNIITWITEKDISIVVEDTPTTVQVSINCLCYHYNGKKLIRKRFSNPITIELNKEGEFVLAKANTNKLYVILYSSSRKEVPPL